MHTSLQNNSKTQPCVPQTLDASGSVGGSDFNDQSILLTSPYTNTSNETDSSGEPLGDVTSKKRPLRKFYLVVFGNHPKRCN
jgi:hypothetical protein